MMNNFRDYKEVMAEHFNTPEKVAEFLKCNFEDYLETGDKDDFLLGLRIATELNENIHGITGLAKETGISREHLYTMLSGKGNPTFENIIKIMKALGFSFEFKASTEKLNHKKAG